MDGRTKIGVITASEYAVESQALQLASNAEGTFEIVASTSVSESSLAPARPTRAYRDCADFVQGEGRMGADSRLDLLCFICPGFDDWTHIAECLRRDYPVLCVDPILPWPIAASEDIFLSAAKKNRFILGFPITCFPMFREMAAIIGDGSTGEISNIDLVLQLSTHGDRIPIWKTLSLIAGTFHTLGATEIKKVLVDGSNENEGCEFSLNFLLRLSPRILSSVRVRTTAKLIRARFELEIRTIGRTACWSMSSPDDLTYADDDGQEYVSQRGNPYTGEAARSLARLRPGNPEGAIQALGSFLSWSRDTALQLPCGDQKPFDLGIIDPEELHGVNQFVIKLGEHLGKLGDPPQGSPIS